MDTLPGMLKTMKDPTISTRALSELLAEDVDGMNVSEGGREGGRGSFLCVFPGYYCLCPACSRR